MKAKVDKLSLKYNLRSDKTRPLAAIFDGRERNEVHGGFTERLYSEGRSMILEVYKGACGQKLGYDSDSSTWFYESWSEGLVEKVWLKGASQWGENSERSGSRTKVVKWCEPIYSYECEEYVTEPGNEYGSKVGTKEAVEWIERWWKKPEEEYLEKSWTEEGRSWGEKEGRFYDRRWKSRWQQYQDEFKTESWNEDPSTSWGHSEGQFSGGSWKTTWCNTSSLQKTEKCWTEGDKKWGTNCEKTSDLELTVDWEEIGEARKELRTYIKENGESTIENEGWGPDFHFKDIFQSDTKETVKIGHDASSNWKSTHRADGSSDYVHNIGSNTEGHWDEKWFHAGEQKWAEKSGNDKNGRWFERWTEQGTGEKSCLKSGSNSDCEWFEEWKESKTYRYCRKEQRLPDCLQVQEWEEFLSPTEKRSIGHHYENNQLVHSWDSTGPL